MISVSIILNNGLRA